MPLRSSLLARWSALRARLDPAQRRRATVAALAVALAALLPLAARGYVGLRLGQLEARLGTALGAEVAIGGIDVVPTGVLELDDVAVADLFAAESIEAGVSPASVLSGHLEADVVRVRRPRLRLAVDERGEPTATALLGRAKARLDGRRRGGATGHGPRRIVVEDGDLELELPGGGVLHADGVELAPAGDAFRVVTGKIALALVHGALTIDARFARAAFDLELPALAVPRLVMTGGEATIHADTAAPGGAALRLPTLAATRTGPDGVRLTGQTASGGAVELVLGKTPGGGALHGTLRELPLAVLGAALPAGLALADARYTGTVAIALGEVASLALRGRLTGAALTHPLLAAEPLPLDADLALDATTRSVAGRRTIALERAELTRGPLALSARGRAELAAGDPLPVRGELDLALAPLPCVALPTVLPGSLGADLAGMAAEGTLSGRVDLVFDRSDPEATRLGLELDAGSCRVRSEPPRLDVRRLLAGFDHRRPSGQVVRIGDGPEAIVLEKLRRPTIGAFVAAEDARFFRHHGFDVEQIERSLAIDLGEGRLLRGGSTISQQLVKNVFVGSDRTLVRKLAEAIVTWRLEAVVPKRVILARYLEIVELGEDVFGLEAAARHYFGKPAAELDIGESAFLAALTPAPRTLSRRLRQSGKLDADLLRRVEIVLRAMRVAGYITREEQDHAVAHPPALRREALARR